MKVVCSQLKTAAQPPAELQYTLFGRPEVKTLGAAGPTLVDALQRFGASPDPRAWDFLAIAVAVVAADEGCNRNMSPDGWTRVIALEVALNKPEFWQSQKDLLEKILRFLTGDIWTLTFAANGVATPQPKKKRVSPEDSVCLLSGGADSLTGAIDLAANGKKPLLVSQVSEGDKGHQSEFARNIVGDGHHLQLNHNISSPVKSAERSQRSRSILFLAYGIVGATILDRYKTDEVILYVPENGFISLNIPLTPLRMGSLSTRTTHPYYMGLMRQLLQNAGLRISLENPFQFKTKGELFKGCQNEALLKRLVCGSTSCGRYKRMAYRHCGRCVPCLIRRSALLNAKITDSTTYVYKDLSIDDDDHKQFDDVKAACYAVHQVVTESLNKWVGSGLSSTQLGETKPYRELLERGVKELGTFLKSVGAM